MESKFQSWGRIKPHNYKQLYHPNSYNLELPKNNLNNLVFGNGRSYGDIAYNNNGLLIVNRQLNHFIEFDRQNGILTAESGVTLYEILNLITGSGWFLAITPGTQFITLGGAIANDVHGKNHHKYGSFGNFVKEFELVRSDGQILNCSPNSNQEFFYATIAGLGLTGWITKVKIQLIPIQTQLINNTSIKFNNLEEYFQLNTELANKNTYTVAWVDCLSSNIGRGIYYSGEHVEYNDNYINKNKRTINYVFKQNFSLINNLSLKIFNFLYYNKKINNHISHYQSFFYPLDSINNWNRIYGKKGFYQYQCVIPTGNDYIAIKEILKHIKKSNQGSFLAVLKTFGNIHSGGLLSFPRMGTTLALDFPNIDDRVQKLFKILDKIVFESNGAIYPAKDALMSPYLFHSGYQNLEKFLKYKDPKFNSNLWQRLMEI
jgi:FAD/FMN-containing dehydrogenase